uniref:Natriuretic peptide receptor 3 n=1 Tax=Tetraodon nigroviridis TaxID=99883 RepID=H3CAI5_TETNG
TMLFLCSLCVALSAALVQAVADVTENIEVLAFLPQNNSYLFSSARVAPAVLYAQRRLEADARFSGFRFNVHFEDSDCVNGAMFALVERACARKPHLILGPVCEYEAAAVVRLASHWNVPVVSAGALAAGFSKKKTEYAQLTRIAPSYVKMGEIFAAMFERFDWRSALLVYEDDRQERNCFFTLEGIYHMLHDVDMKTYPLDDGVALDTDKVLQNIVDTEAVVIMCMPAEKIRELMLAAHARQLTGGNHMFFNVDLFNASSYGNGSWKKGDKHDNNAKQAFAFLNTVTLLRTVKPEFEVFSEEMKASVKKAEFQDCNDCADVNMFVEGFHDAVLLYAIALYEATKHGYSKRNGTEITSRMWNRTFEGIAGPVSIDENGDRNGDFSLIAMTNTSSGTYEAVANYFGGNGSFQLLPGISADRFTLKGQRKPPPEITEKSCGLGVSALTGVIVGAVLGAAMLITFYFIRKNYKITIERRTQAEECNTAKHRQLREDSIRSNFSV